MLGSQWGDEGKGKLVDILAQRYDIVARCQARGLPELQFRMFHGHLRGFASCLQCRLALTRRLFTRTHVQGGANAGHTIYDAAGKKYALHLVPSGILNPGAQCVIGNGVVVHVPGLFAEIDALEAAGVKVRHSRVGLACQAR